MASEPKTPPPRRENDDDGADYNYVRRKYPDVRRTIGTLATILVPVLLAGLIWFASKDRDEVIRKAETAQATANEARLIAVQAVAAQAQQQAVANVQWQEILRRLDSIETTVKAVRMNTQN